MRSGKIVVQLCYFKNVINITLKDTDSSNDMSVIEP